MTLVLTHGYFLADDPIEQKIMRPYPPLGILSISAWLEQEHIPHKVIDTTFITQDDFCAEIQRIKPHIIAFYATLMTRQPILQLIQQIKKNNIPQDTAIVLGGPDGRYNAHAYLQHGVDVIVTGEGEQTMAALARLPQLKTPDQFTLTETATALAAIPGLIFKGANGQQVETPSRKHLPDLADLPVPARHNIDISKYLHTWKTAHGESALNVSTQRGCPYSCNWCSKAVYGTSYRRRPYADVVAELQSLQKTYQPDLFWFVDDVFTVNHRWLRNFAHELTAQNVKIRYECITRADRMNHEVVDLLAKSGCKRLWIGAESGSQRILDAMNRQVSVETVTSMIRAASDAGIETGTFIMLGYPEETEQDIIATRRYLKQARPDQFTVTLAYPIKGTSFYHAIETEIQPADFTSGSDRDHAFPRTYSDRYYHHALRYLNHAYYHDHLQPTSLLNMAKIMRHKLVMAAARTGMWFQRTLRGHLRTPVAVPDKAHSRITAPVSPPSTDTAP
jgi:radical SAM superfamily enzyme YgiQ (UPF0313 family)